MKRTLVILLAIISLNAKSQEQMSYLQNEDTIKFSVSEELYSITYDDTLENLIKTRFIDDFMKIGNGHAIIKISNVSGKDFDDKREILQDSFEGIVYSIEPVLIYEDGTIQMTHNAILVQANDQRVLSQIFSDYNYTVEEIKVVNLKNFLVKIDGLSTIEIFQIVSKHCHDKNIISIEPSFIRIIQVDSWETPNDPLFSDQWNIFGNQYIDTKVINAWSITKGENVKTAIFDGGIDLNHPDLIDNIVGGYDATNHNTNGGYHDVWEAHGTECAGIVAAKGNNDIGIVGVAPNSKIFSVKIAMLDRNGVMTMSDSEFARGLAESIRQGARIFSNSWGGGSQSANRTNNINSCINNAYDGKGCVVVFASGNKNNPSVSYPSSLSSVISVGAISPCGERKSPTSCDGENWGSNYGTGLNVVAPGVFIPTTDISGVLGATSSDYNMAFNGTSAACPFVAGVAALVLSVNPNLTQKQVKDIIEQTAQKIRPDLYDYNTYATRPNGTWNIQMGYGLVDVYAAVQKAKDMDLYIRDVETDNGVEPSNTNGCMWNSSDIWIEDFDNNVVDNPRGGEEYYVCVRVHNNKNISSTGTEKLYLNWAKAGTDLRWRSSWDGEHFFNCDRAVLKGDVIDKVML